MPPESSVPPKAIIKLLISWSPRRVTVCPLFILTFSVVSGTQPQSQVEVLVQLPEAIDSMITYLSTDNSFAGAAGQPDFLATTLTVPVPLLPQLTVMLLVVPPNA
ncbi:hypothetical protein ES705_16120 [subsurface metagenome]